MAKDRKKYATTSELTNAPSLELAAETRLPLPKTNSPVDSSELDGLIAGFVHEIRNPLAALHMHLQLLESYTLEVENSQLKKKLNDKIQFLKREILNLSKSMKSLLLVFKQSKNMERQTCNINDIIFEVMELIGIQAKHQNVEIDFLQGELPAVNFLDPSFIRQIVLNLILNSLQAFPQEINQETKKLIQIVTMMKKGALIIEILDNGPGISKEIQSRIFTPFFSKGKNTGIGLTLVKSMVNSMNGILELRTEENKGTNFIIKFMEPMKQLTEKL